MSKTEYAWVIQRDDGKYVNFMDNEDLTWYEHTWQATMTWSKHQAEKDIILLKLQNCRPVKVKIEIVGEQELAELKEMSNLIWIDLFHLNNDNNEWTKSLNKYKEEAQAKLVGDEFKPVNTKGEL